MARYLAAFFGSLMMMMMMVTTMILLLLMMMITMVIPGKVRVVRPSESIRERGRGMVSWLGGAQRQESRRKQ